MGLFEFVFGKGAPKDENAPKEAFYLTPDDAKSFGDIEYMRSSKTVKRTFAKKKGETEHMESVKQISATTASEVSPVSNNSYAQPSVTFASVAASIPATPAPAAEPAPAAAEAKSESAETESAPAPAAEPAPRRKPNNDMDMFRNMAKSIRK